MIFVKGYWIKKNEYIYVAASEGANDIFKKTEVDGSIFFEH